MKISPLVLASVLLATPAAAQMTAQAPAPSDLEIESARVKMLEGQLGYFIAYLRRLEADVVKMRGEAAANLADAKATADWWASYAAAVPPQAAK